MFTDINKAINKHVINALSQQLSEEFDLDQQSVKKIIASHINPQPTKTSTKKTRVEKIKMGCEKKVRKMSVRQQELHLSRVRGEWVIQGTKLVVRGPSDKVVVGKLIGGCKKKLGADDLELCEKNKWIVE